MQFRTEIFLPKSNLSIDHRSKIVFCGSCFTEHIGDKFHRYRFATYSNSHGILFNPVSIASALNDCLEKRVYNESDLVLHNQVFCSFNHHGKFNRSESREILNLINREIERAHSSLLEADVLFITLGSAFAYIDKPSERVVANCHKITQTRFTKILLDHNRIGAALNEVLLKLRKVNPAIKIVFTVSPVRHLKDGIIENQISKSNLILACHNLIASLGETFYFPAYEILMDDLRDYRFYNQDMIHPNQTAVNYVWNKLIDWCISDRATVLMEKMESLIAFGEHRLLNPENDTVYHSARAENEQKIRDLLEAEYRL